MTVEVEDFLAHYGILGMHWGVRKKEDSHPKTPRTLEQKAALRKKVLIVGGITLAVGAVAVAAMLSRPKLIEHFEVKKASDLLLSDIKNNPDLSVLADKGHRYIDEYIMHDVKIPFGTNFQRVSKTMESSINKPKYATYLKEDIISYRATFNSPFLKDGAQKFKTSFKTLSDTSIAGQNTLLKATTRLASENSKLSGLMRAETIAHYKNYSDPIQYDIIRKKIINAPVDELAKRWIDLNSGGDWTSPISEKLFSGLAKAGYVGITDNNDSAGLAKHAVVLINDSLVKTIGSKMSISEIETAKKLLENYL